MGLRLPRQRPLLNSVLFGSVLVGQARCEDPGGRIDIVFLVASSIIAVPLESQKTQSVMKSLLPPLG